jgi:sodium transport system permease protein
VSLDPRFVAVLSCELRRLLRDRRALFMAVVLPMLLYPLYFVGAKALGAEAERRMETQEVTLLVDLGALDTDLFGALDEQLDGVEQMTTVFAVFEPPVTADDEDGASPDAQWLSERMEAVHEGATGWLVAERGPDDELALVLWHDGSSERGQELRSRLRSTLAEFSDAFVDRELERRLDVDPDLTLALEPHDRAEPADAAGANFGRFLPIVSVMILISGGAYAALDAFAAEREQGTLETLLVQPVPVRIVSWAKFCAVALSAGAALLGNLGSLVGSAAAGIVPSGVEGADVGAALLGPLFAGRLSLALLLGLPGALLVAAVLCALSARARTYREAQTMILPLSIAGLVATAPATLPGVELVPTLAAVPLVGTSLAMREALAGNLGLVPALLSVISSGAAAYFALARVGTLLDLESVLQHGDTETESALRQRRARRALSTGWAAVFLIYFVGSYLQAQSLVYGLATTLWVLAVGLALLLARAEARDDGTSLARPLGLARPPLASLAAIPFAVVGLAGLAGILFAWQSQVLPLPRGFGGEIDQLVELGPWIGLFLLALTPGVCEELLFRGSIQSGMMRDWTPVRAIFWQALLFGLAHASIHRFLPTFTIGVVLGFVRWRTGSILPGVAIHALYNGLLVAATAGWFADDVVERLQLVDQPLAALALPVALGLVWSAGRARRPLT